MRIFESECIYCGCSAVLNSYCRQCEATQPVILITSEDDKDAPSHNPNDKFFPDDFFESDTELYTEPNPPCESDKLQ